MGNRPRWSFTASALILAVFLAAPGFSRWVTAAGIPAAPASFRFLAWGDTKSATSVLSALSDQAIQLNPVLTLYAGDLESSGFTQSGMDKWKSAMNGQLSGDTTSNGMFDRTFPVRGNHDNGNTAGWQGYYNLSATAAAVGATNYAFLSGQDDLTYSFDFGNSHFVGVDVTGDADKISSQQVAWIDQDLSAAEGRGLVHAFIVFHGPIYCVDGHCSYNTRVASTPSQVQALIKVLNKHPIITATFHGHEHTYAYTYLDSTRIPASGSFEGVTRPFHQFVTGDAGAGPDSCNANRCDYNMAKHGFVTVDVAGSSVSVSFYEQGKTTPVKVIAFDKSGGPTPTAPPLTVTPSWTVTRTATSYPTVHPTVTAQPTTPPPPTPTIAASPTADPNQSFVDVPPSYWAFSFIESLYRAGYVSGCSAQPLMYCPNGTMIRGEGAVFVVRGVRGAGYMPPQPSQQRFADVLLSAWYAKWAEALWQDGFTAGCGANPLVFCPVSQHTRAEGAVFFERMIHGREYLPPEPTQQVYDDVPVGPGAPWYSKWVAAAYQDQLLQECEDPPNRGDRLFRPAQGLTRAEAACMMVKAKSNPTPTATPSSTQWQPTNTPRPSPTVPPGGQSGIWISAQELAALPMSGPAWQSLKSEADSSVGTPDLSNQDQRNNVTVLAKALVFARTGDERYRAEVRQQLEMAIDTELGGETLAFGRELVAYVIAADLIHLKEYDPAFDNGQFRPWLRRGLSETLDGKTLVSTHEDRPNNWGTHAGASRIAVAIYLGDRAELERAAQVFKGWLGDRSAYAGFKYDDLSWQCDPSNPVGINPAGCTKQGHSVDGVLPDDQRRGGGFTWPPPHENYVWEALQGALVQAVLLHRAGYDVWNWEDQALLRAARWLHEQASFPATGDDSWQPHIINFYYGTGFPAPVPSSPGKNLGWTDWTHGGR